MDSTSNPIISEHQLRDEYRRKLNASPRVWCDWSEQVARTADGFCEFCGKTDHESWDV